MKTERSNERYKKTIAENECLNAEQKEAKTRAKSIQAKVKNSRFLKPKKPLEERAEPQKKIEGLAEVSI